MNSEKFPKPKESGLGMSIRLQETFRHPLFTGEIFLEIRNGKTGELIHKDHFKNIVTKDASILIARLMKSPPIPNTSEPSFGCFALAVGTGDVGWDLQNPPPGTITQRSLYNEIGRKQFSAASFIDEDGAISSIPTNVVDFTTQFSESEAVGAIVEMGVLGGDVNTNMAITNPILPPNGTYDPTVDVTGKDMLGNYKTFAVKNKNAGETLTLTWRFTF
jgi:hypothetical protein